MKNLSDYQIFPELLTSLLIRGIQMGDMSKLGLLIGLVKHSILARFVIFPVPAITFNFQNPSVIPAYPMTPFIGMMG
jgi:hypothetical protein